MQEKYLSQLPTRVGGESELADDVAWWLAPENEGVNGENETDFESLSGLELNIVAIARRVPAHDQSVLELSVDYFNGHSRCRLNNAEIAHIKAHFLSHGAIIKDSSEWQEIELTIMARLRASVNTDDVHWSYDTHDELLLKCYGVRSSDKLNSFEEPDKQGELVESFAFYRIPSKSSILVVDRSNGISTSELELKEWELIDIKSLKKGPRNSVQYWNNVMDTVYSV